MMLNNKEFKKLLKKKGFTQWKVAEELGITQATLSRKLSNSCTMTANEFFKLKEILNPTEEEYAKLFVERI